MAATASGFFNERDMSSPLRFGPWVGPFTHRAAAACETAASTLRVRRDLAANAEAVAVAEPEPAAEAALVAGQRRRVELRLQRRRLVRGDLAGGERLVDLGRRERLAC